MSPGLSSNLFAIINLEGLMHQDDKLRHYYFFEVLIDKFGLCHKEIILNVLSEYNASAKVFLSDTDN